MTALHSDSDWFWLSMIKTSVERDKRFGQRHVIQIPKSCVQCCCIFSFVTLLLSGFVIFHILAEDSEAEKTPISTFDIGLKIVRLIFIFGIFYSEYERNEKIYDYRESQDYKELVSQFKLGSSINYF